MNSTQSMQCSDKCCPDCGSPSERLSFSIKGLRQRYYGDVLTCDCTPPSYEKRHKLNLVESSLKAQLMGRFAKMTFSNWIARKQGDDPVLKVEREDPILKVKSYVKEANSIGRNWLYCFGPYGTGKTHLAVAAMRQMALERCEAPLLVEWGAYCSMQQDSWKQKEKAVKQLPTVENIINAGIVLLDDIDKRSMAVGALGRLYDIVNGRWTQGRKTILTANREPNELANTWGMTADMADLTQAIVSRIKGAVHTAAVFSATDFRVNQELDSSRNLIPERLKNKKRR